MLDNPFFYLWSFHLSGVLGSLLLVHTVKDLADPPTETTVNNCIKTVLMGQVMGYLMFVVAVAAYIAVLFENAYKYSRK